MRYVKRANGLVPFSKDVADATLMELSPATGMSASHSLTRNTTATLIDYEGLIRMAKPNELRMEKARRVENLFLNSGSPATQNITVEIGRDYTISLSGGSIILSGAGTGTVTTELTITATTTTLTCTTSDAVEPQVEDVTGQADQTASEYITKTVVDSDKIFGTDVEVPTEAELIAETTGAGVTPYGSFLKLTIAGHRLRANATIGLVGSRGYYWTSTVNGTNSIRLSFSATDSNFNSYNRARGYSVRLIVKENSSLVAGDTITMQGLNYGVIASPHTGRLWLDRNLGASQVATSSTDTLSYGDLYQWGRETDGHEKRDSATTATLASGVNNAGNRFITSSASPYDWTTADSTGVLRASLNSSQQPAATLPDPSSGVANVKYFTTKKDGSPLDEEPYFLVEKQGTNLFLNSDNPATQTIAVTSGNDYIVSVIGLGSITLSGAASGTVTEGNSLTINTSSTSLVCTLSGTLNSVQVEQSNYPSSYIPTSGTAVTRSADIIKYEFGAGNFPQEFAYVTDIEPLIDVVVDADNNSYRLFGTQDTTSTNNEFTSIGSGTYGFANGVAGGNFAVDINDTLVIGDKTKYALQARSSEQKIFMDGIEKMSEADVLTGAHSGTGTLEIANWAGQVMPMKIYSVKLIKPTNDIVLSAITKL